MRDEWFVRGKIPMTKEEVRAVSIAKLELEKDSVIYDIGAGTGSVTVEAICESENGRIYAFEQKEEGCELIRENLRRAGVFERAVVVNGRAPECLSGYPVPDRVFIGGSGGNLPEILDLLFRKNPSVRIVINVIALESLSQITEYCARRGLIPDVTCIQASRAKQLGAYHLMQGMNPVYVLTLDGREREEKKREGIPRLLLAAPSSGSGKTVITSGLLALLAKRGISCVSFKCGPDYIDPMFHRYVLGIPGSNLDSFFLDEDGVRELFKERSAGHQIALIEGVMGYYDGVAGTFFQASSYEIARITDTPVILVVDGKKSSRSIAALIKGFLDYQKDSRIVGVILNRTSPMMRERLRPLIEELGVALIGTVPECPEAQLESRHLGLTLPDEQEKLRSHMDALADRLEQCLDMDKLFALAGMTDGIAEETQEQFMPEDGTEDKPENKQENVTKNMAKNMSKDTAETPKKSVTENAIESEEKDMSEAAASDQIQDWGYGSERRIGVAQDEAFCFYYQENLEFLRKNGWEIVTFSPLHDEKLPDGLDAILLGGGYPELYAQSLSQNQSMIESIRQAKDAGIKILAECGGFLYLHRTLEDPQGRKWPMAGLINADAFQTKKLSRFGYITLRKNEYEMTLPDIKIRGHEFHYWDSTDPGSSWIAEKPLSSKKWACMHVNEQMIAGFAHLYYRSGAEYILEFLNGGGQRE